ncbi:allantoinase PuuE [Aestuariibacter halophilus]|uniref:Allantoinase PuuE n=1 Tax=Fluctibacter halophilus TaxID=226011 RepID=A0ABS8G571_9ALTE|nr:allantoinase PuuE [Aestuariibacter halophilus]MCC2615732.1 allantoinase PuuE [Aestuariibacter halophilus]
MKHAYPRDLVGYGKTPPHPQWPGKARIAVQFVINYEEGGENCVLHGDPSSEVFLSEIIGAEAYNGRHMSMESIYEYGSRAGFWRLYRLFTERQIPITVFGVTMALQRNPDAVEAMLEANWEIASHAMRWIHFQHMDIVQERKLMNASIQLHQAITGQKPAGWYTGRTSPNTLKLVAERDDIVYCADSYADDLPYYDTQYRNPLLMIPYTLDANDMRFATAQGFNSGEQFFQYLKDSFDVLYEEGQQSPKMMSVGLHCRLAGRPGRFAALQRFVDYVQSQDNVWLCRRVEIAEHWRRQFPLPTSD